MITANLTTIELLAELQSRGMQGLDALMRNAYEKARNEARTRWKFNRRKVCVWSLHPAWRMPTEAK